MRYYQKNLALGSEVQLSLVSSDNQGQIDDIFHALWHKIFLFERQFSRFLPGSELSVFNKNAGTKQYVTPEFRDVLAAAQKMGVGTGGLYNPFILPALQAAGYTHSRVKGHEHDAVDNHAQKTVVSSDRLEIGDDWARIPYGTAIDLGGCGKGYLADLLADELGDAVTGYWLSLGGDIAAGGTDESGKPWEIGIQSVTGKIDDDIGTIQLPSNGRYGIATSGTTVHHGKKAGKAWHHLIDPRTLAPAQTDVLLATVCDASALRADVLASCSVILGAEEGLDFLRSQGVTAALLQGKKPDGESFATQIGNAIIVDTIHA